MLSHIKGTFPYLLNHHHQVIRVLGKLGANEPAALEKLFKISRQANLHRGVQQQILDTLKVCTYAMDWGLVYCTNNESDL